MSGRRSHPRFVVAGHGHGTMRLLHEAIVARASQDELLAVCHAPGIRDEEMSLDLMGQSESLSLKVKVVESRPVIVAGSVRHRLRLVLMATAEQPDDAAAAMVLTVGANGPN